MGEEYTDPQLLEGHPPPHIWEPGQRHEQSVAACLRPRLCLSLSLESAGLVSPASVSLVPRGTRVCGVCHTTASKPLMCVQALSLGDTLL